MSNANILLQVEYERNSEIRTAQLIKGNGYEARQTSLLYVFVSIFGLDRARTKTDFEMSHCIMQFEGSDWLSGHGI